MRLAGLAAALALLMAACAGNAPETGLPALRLDPQRVAVAGLSSGAYMATQVHLAFSQRIDGAALIAGGPYGCAGGDLKTALGPCMSAQPAAPDVDMLAARAREHAAAGRIDPLDGLTGDRVYVLHGRRDDKVAEAVSTAAAQFYRAVAGDAVQVQTDFEHDFGHGLPTRSAGVDCIGMGTPWLGHCDFDAAGAAVTALFGAPSAEPRDEASGELIRFDQRRYDSPDRDSYLGDDGYLYVPSECAAGDAACGLLVVFHGCQQQADALGDRFVREAGFNRWADAQHLVVLYPQTRATYVPLNPKACWDWWGYSGSDYDLHSGAQLQWLANAVAALGLRLQP